jgi:hypothetical protein
MSLWVVSNFKYLSNTYNQTWWVPPFKKYTFLHMSMPQTHDQTFFFIEGFILLENFIEICI